MSWISPFSNERELLIKGKGMAIFEAPKLDWEKLDKSCFAKKVIIFKFESLGSVMDLIATKISGYLSIVKENLIKFSNLNEILEQHGLRYHF